MANRVILVGWDRPTPGYEMKAMGMIPTFLEFLSEMQARGLIESFEPILLRRHGGDLNGMVLIRGDAEKLAEMQTKNTWTDLTVAAAAFLDSFGVIEGYIGDSFNDIMARYTKALTT